MAVNIYKVTETAEVCNDYKVKVNSVKAQLNTARVSAVPFNRRWPGHQRGKEQSELINFLSLCADEPVTFEIETEKPFENVTIRPLSLGITPEIKEGKIIFTLQKPAYFTVEPFGRNNALHIFVDPIPEYNVDKNAPDVIYYGAGEHDVGQIILESNQTLFIDEGAVVYACVKAKDAENIKILGRGILDNSRNKAQILFEHNAKNNDVAIKNAKRQHTIQPEYCTNIVIDGITIRDSLVYNIRPSACKNLKISNVKIIGCWRYNSDGIDMHNCSDIIIDNCFIRTFDDSICVKGFDCYYAGDVQKAVEEAMHHNGEVYDVFKNAVIKNCTIWNDWGKCLEIGAETRAEEIFDITFENCNIIHAMGPVLDLYNVDYADVHNVIYKDINVEYDDVIPAPLIQNSDDELYENQDPEYSPLLISVITEAHHEYSAGGTRRGISRDITFKNIHLFGLQKPRLYFKGCDGEHKSKDITVENLYWNGKLIKGISEEASFVKGDFTENISYKVSDYSQLQKNTVSAKNQLKDSSGIRFFDLENNGKRIMFVGNSITLHGVRPEIGWHGDWGMAASGKEKDYVHLIMSKTKENNKDCAFCICQVAAFESDYKNGEEYYNRYQNARSFEADIIIMRFVENCPKDGFDEAIFKKQAKGIIDNLNPTGKAKIIVTTSFWHHPGDNALKELANENNLPLITLGDLGEKDEMKAKGLFSHLGVANHPGDLGMETIAYRIFTVLKEYL